MNPNNLRFCLALLSLIALCIIPGQIFAQMLYGTIIGDDGSIPRDGKIVILGVDEDEINSSNGAFSVDLSSCNNCSQIELHISSSYGSMIVSYNIPIGTTSSSRLTKNIVLERNNLMNVMGIVRSEKTGKLLPGIQVTVLIPGQNIQPFVTNHGGIFQFTLNKIILGQQAAVTLLFEDVTNDLYQSETVLLRTNLPDPFTIELKENPNPGQFYEIEINTTIRTGIQLKRGDAIEIKASGSMRVGNFIGNSGPEGVRSPIADGWLAEYSFIKTIPHAALIYRFNEQDKWKAYDPNSSNQHIIQQDGVLEMAINDRQEYDNEGAYQVKVNVKR